MRSALQVAAGILGFLILGLAAIVLMAATFTWIGTWAA